MTEGSEPWQLEDGHGRAAGFESRFPAMIARQNLC